MRSGASRSRRRAWLACLATPLLAYVLTAPLGGCTVLFGAIGALSDAGTPGPGVVPRERIVLLKRGAQVELEMIDGNRLKGTYQGVGQVGSDACRERYESWRATRPAEERWPAFGDTATLIREGKGAVATGRFQGFSILGVVLESPSPRHLPPELRYSSFDRVAFRGVSVERGALLESIRTASPPSRTAILVATTRNVAPRQIPLERIGSVVVTGQREGATRGMIVGLTLDALVVVVAVAAASSYHGAFGSSGGCTSASMALAPAPADFDLRQAAFVPEAKRATGRAARFPVAPGTPPGATPAPVTATVP